MAGSCARVVITSRPIPFDRNLVAEILPVPSPCAASFTPDEFAAFAMGETRREKAVEGPPAIRFVELRPLSGEQIMAFAASQGIEDPEAFLAEIHRRGITEFAERPQDLIEVTRRGACPSVW